MWLTTAVLHESVLRTLDLPAGDRFDAWTERMGRTHAPMQRDLADPALRTLPIHAIAARWGFPRAAEFTRAFRSAHGVPPSEFRQRSGSPAE
ncbi:hypothetical protein GCM10010276_11120 [Streptomyces longisporus]|uniref:HTH araC/xylS-type domain-containing protein n=1 Tax=Streptomyces longisporus TaxID=1948 RepID=A0ABN3L5Y9_STRLO